MAPTFNAPVFTDANTAEFFTVWEVSGINMLFATRKEAKLMLAHLGYVLEEGANAEETLSFWHKGGDVCILSERSVYI